MQPLSLEELLKKEQQEQEAEAKVGSVAGGSRGSMGAANNSSTLPGCAPGGVAGEGLMGRTRRLNAAGAHQRNAGTMHQLEERNAAWEQMASTQQHQKAGGWLQGDH